MAKEPDQTKWVGIRPTDPSEDIPTTTKKILPAISDLQAVKEVYHETKTGNNKDCTVQSLLNGSLVPAGELWIINHVMVVNLDSMCDMLVSFRIAALYYQVAAFYSVEANQRQDWRGHLILEEGDYMQGYYVLGGATDDIKLHIFGYKIGVY